MAPRTYAAGDRFEGEFSDGVMHGTGTYHFADGCTYQGEYQDGKRNGRGKSANARKTRD